MTTLDPMWDATPGNDPQTREKSQRIAGGHYTKP
jgi:hypothetical protein